MPLQFDVGVNLGKETKKMNNNYNTNYVDEESIDKTNSPKKKKEMGMVPFLTIISVAIESLILSFLHFGMPIIKSGFKFEFLTRKNLIISSVIFTVVVFFTVLINFITSKKENKSFLLDFIMIIVGIIGFSIVLGIFGTAGYFLLNLFLFGSNFFISIIIMAVVGFMVYKLMID